MLYQPALLRVTIRGAGALPRVTMRALPGDTPSLLTISDRAPGVQAEHTAPISSEAMRIKTKRFMIVSPFKFDPALRIPWGWNIPYRYGIGNFRDSQAKR